MRTLSLILCFLVSALCSAQSGLPVRHWTIDGVDREALVYAPNSAGTVKTPVIFAFHGHGATMQSCVNYFGFQKLWPEAIVVYMQGLPTAGTIFDRGGKFSGWQRKADSDGGRDLKFFDTVLASLKKRYRVDSKRVFAMGHSNGGYFTYLLWAQRGNELAAVAPACAADEGDLSLLKPKPVIHIAGQSDRIVRFTWQQRTIEGVRQLDDCESKGTPWAKEGSVVGTFYPSKGGTPLVTLIYEGGHLFPRDVPPLIVRFFKESTSK